MQARRRASLRRLGRRAARESRGASCGRSSRSRTNCRGKRLREAKARPTNRRTERSPGCGTKAGEGRLRRGRLRQAKARTACRPLPCSKGTRPFSHLATGQATFQCRLRRRAESPCHRKSVRSRCARTMRTRKTNRRERRMATRRDISPTSRARKEPVPVLEFAPRLLQRWRLRIGELLRISSEWFQEECVMRDCESPVCGHAL